jgi:copper chaperone CopZ
MNRSFRSMGLGLALMIVSAVAGAAPQVYALRVDGLACPFCAYRLEKQISAIEGIEQIKVDIETGIVTVTMSDGATLDDVRAKQVVEGAGFSLRHFEQTQGAEDK